MGWYPVLRSLFERKDFSYIIICIKGNILIL